MRGFLLFLAVLLFVVGHEAYAETSDTFTEGTIKWSKLNYRIANGTATAAIIVSDADMNKIPTHVDTLFVKAFSDTFPEGITLELYETEKNSGQFERTFTLSEERFAPSILYMKEGDTLTATYLDQTLPSGSSDVLAISATSLAGSTGPPLERIPASSFRIIDNHGHQIQYSVPSGQQVHLSADLSNNYNKTQDFVYLVQTEDMHGRAVSLSWIEGTMTPFQKLSTSQSWIPQETGMYQATAFVWESLDNPSALSPPLSIEVDVFLDLDITSIETSGESISEFIFSACKQDDDCTIRFLQKLSNERSSEQVFDTIDELLTLYDDSDFYCHPNAHHIGEFLLGYVKGDISKAINYVDHRCASGILHGLTENTIPIETLLHGKNVDDVDIVTPCNVVDSYLGHDAMVECIHGMGHSITKAYDYDVVSAVDKCDVYPDGNQRYMCQGGLFMQNINKYWDDQGGDFDENDSYYPCNKIDDDKSALCYRYQGLYFLKQNDYDETIAYDMCNKIENSGHADLCYKGVATHVASRDFDDIDGMLSMCMEVDEFHQAICVRGVVESLTRFASEDLAQEFCESVPESLAGGCYERLDQLLEARY